MLKSIYITEGLRFFLRRIKVGKLGFSKKTGDAKKICTEIVKECYNNGHFSVSKHNFQNFYCRDLGWCAKQLLNLGHKNEIISSLDYALNIFRKHGSIKVSISNKGIPFNFPNNYSIDSVSYLFYVLSLVNDPKLINKYKSFLILEAEKFIDFAVDIETGLVKKGNFSAMRDHTYRNSSCYDNVMVWLMQQSLKKLGIDTQLSNYNYKKIIKNNFWNGKYFYDDLNKKSFFVSDANIYPFWFGLFTDKKMIKSVVSQVKKDKLDKPFPLKYVNKRAKHEKYIFYEYFVKNWESDSIWPQMGFAYIEILNKIDKKSARVHFMKYSELIEKYGTFLEVFNRTGNPYKTMWYISDEGLIWASMYLYLEKKLTL